MHLDNEEKKRLLFSINQNDLKKGPRKGLF